MKADVAQIKDAEAMARPDAGKIINIASMYAINAPAASLRAARDFSELDRSGRYPD